MFSKIFRGAGMMFDMATSEAFHQHIPTLKEAAKANFERRFPSPQKKLALAKATALEKHMLTFSDKDGVISAKSIYVSLIYDWHLSEADAKNLAEATMQAAYYEGVPGVYMALTGIQGQFLPSDAKGLLPHPRDLAIFNRKNGRLDPQQFERLNSYATSDSNGALWISEKGIRAFNKDWQKEDTYWSNADILSKLIGYLGNQGEFRLLYSRAVSCTIDGVGYIRLDDLLQFYRDSAVTVAAIKSGALPVTQNIAGAFSGSSTTSIMDRLKNKAGEYVTGVVDNCPSYFPPDNPTYWQQGSSNHPPLFSNSTSLNTNTNGLPHPATLGVCPPRP